MKIAELMCTSVRSCSPSSTLADAAEIMWAFDCGCVPVVDESNRVVGMITDRDVCMAAYLSGRPLGALAVCDSMSTGVLSCRPEDKLSDAARVMRSAQVRRLPVIDDEGHLVGVVSLNDLALTAGRGTRASASDLSLADLGLTLGGVSRHRSEASARSTNRARNNGGAAGATP